MAFQWASATGIRVRQFAEFFPRVSSFPLASIVAVLIHELAHASWGDNLIRLFYELSLCALWFHPLIWLAEARIDHHRELSRDESVIRRSHGQELVSALAELAVPEGAGFCKHRRHHIWAIGWYAWQGRHKRHVAPQAWLLSFLLPSLWGPESFKLLFHPKALPHSLAAHLSRVSASRL
jgi:hypothetical protein